MNYSREAYDIPIAPLPFVPGCIREAQEIAEQTGCIGGAVAEIFERADIDAVVAGDTSAWENTDQGALFIGDHSNGVERAPLLAIFGKMEREDIRFVAKPFSMTARAVGSLGIHSADLTLPVIPGTLASDRDSIYNRDLGWRIFNRGSLPNKDEIKKLNTNTLLNCADLTGHGHGVSIFPAGGVMDAAKKPWHNGIGRIIKALPEEAQETVTLVPFRFDHFSKLRLLSNLAMRNHSTPTRTQTITMRLGRQGSVRQLLGDTTEADARDITEELRRQFVTELSDARP